MDLLNLLFVIDEPELVVCVIEVEVGNTVSWALNELLDVITKFLVSGTTIGKEDRADVGVLDSDCLCAVLFWSLTCLLVLLNEAIVVLLAREKRIETNL